jgi:hypothetical protein
MPNHTDTSLERWLWDGSNSIGMAQDVDRSRRSNSARNLAWYRWIAWRNSSAINSGAGDGSVVGRAAAMGRRHTGGAGGLVCWGRSSMWLHACDNKSCFDMGHALQEFR